MFFTCTRHARGLLLLRKAPPPYRNLHRTLSAGYRARSKEEGLGRTSADSWERWEFGNESFIDEALKEPLQSDEVSLGEAPTKDGKTCYLEAIAALRPFISDERRAKMDEVLVQRTGSVR